MHIAQPLWLIAAVAGAALLLWSYRRQERSRAALLTVFTSSRLVRQLTRSVSMKRLWLKRVSMIAATVCVCVALARPQGGYTIETAHRKGLDILVAIDTSRSMLTPDVKPNRLTRAKMAAEDLLGHLNGDGVGLIAFAGNAFLQSPITTDYDAFRDSVEALDTNTIPRGGTNIAAPIRLAQSIFKNRPGSDKILILMTDGEDLDAEGVAAARLAAQQGSRILTIGVGTPAGDLIPVPGGNGGTRYLTDASGRFVKSHLDVSTLQQIAQAAGGLYEPLGNEGQGLDLIYSRGLASFARHDLAAQRLRVYREWFQWPLLAGIALLMADSLLLTRRRTLEPDFVPPGQRRHPLANRMASAAPAALAVLGLSISTVPDVAHASPADAEKAYDHGDYAQASKEYEASARKQPSTAQLQFNVGAAAYKSGDLATATTAFESAVKFGNPAVQALAYYNLGNTQYRMGQRVQSAQPQTTVERWQQALKSYNTALQLRPGDADAKFNHDLVQHKLAQLQEQQKHQQNEQQEQHQNGTAQPQHSSGSSQQQNSRAGGQGGNKAQGSKQGGQGQGQNPAAAQNQGQGQQGRGSQSEPGQKSGRDQGHSPGPHQNPGAPDHNSTENSGDAQGSPDRGQTQARGQGTSAANTGGARHPGGGPSQSSQADSAPEAARGSGAPVAAAGMPPGRAASQSGSDNPGAGPGELTREDAEHLLDSLKSDERRLAAASAGSNSAPDDNAPPSKDW